MQLVESTVTLNLFDEPTAFEVRWRCTSDYAHAYSEALDAGATVDEAERCIATVVEIVERQEAAGVACRWHHRERTLREHLAETLGWNATEL